VDALVSFTAGADAAADAARAWLRAWALGELDDDEGMRTPAQFRMALRDCYIRHAAGEIDARSLWGRAGILVERIKTFELLRWPVWEPFAEPPRQADAVDAWLFMAWKIGPLPIPQSQGGLFRKL